MHIQNFKTFCDLVETKSFSKAARLNEVTQSAVSQQLKAMDKVMMVCSTTGDGDVPMMGEYLWEALENSDADLQTVNYSMCALGDSSHSTFCGAGRKIDARMMEMGAKAIVRRHECDADTDGAEEWSKEVLEKLKVI